MKILSFFIKVLGIIGICWGISWLVYVMPLIKILDLVTFIFIITPFILGIAILGFGCYLEDINE